MGELIKFEQLNPVEVFTNNGLDPIIEEIEKIVKSHVPDMTTKAGQADIRSLATKIRGSKAELTRMANKLTEGLRTSVKSVNTERDRMIARMVDLEATARQPLTDFENREKNRIAKHKEALTEMERVRDNLPENLQQLKNILKPIVLNEIDSIRWEEYADSARNIRAETITKLQRAISDIETREAEKAEAEKQRMELEQLRKEKEERERKDREEQLKKEAAEAARVEAENEAKEKAAEVERKAKAEKDRIEKEKREAEEKTARLEREKKAAEEKAKQDKIDAEEREIRLKAIADRDRLIAEKKAEKDKQDAIVLERKRIEAIAKKEKEEAEKREANVKHRKKINNAAVDAIVSRCSDREAAIDIVILIAKGEVPNVSIRY